MLKAVELTTVLATPSAMPPASELDSAAPSCGTLSRVSDGSVASSLNVAEDRHEAAKERSKALVAASIPAKLLGLIGPTEKHALNEAVLNSLRNMIQSAPCWGVRLRELKAVARVKHLAKRSARGWFEPRLANPTQERVIALAQQVIVLLMPGKHHPEPKQKPPSRATKFEITEAPPLTLSVVADDQPVRTSAEVPAQQGMATPRDLALARSVPTPVPKASGVFSSMRTVFWVWATVWSSRAQV